MPLILPMTVTDPTDLPALPSNFENELFQNPKVTSWYTADAEYIATTTQSAVTRATTISDRTPNAKHLNATFVQSFVWNPGTNFDPEIGGATFLRADDTTKGYVSPIDPWPTGDHFKVFFFKAATPASARYLQGATGGGGAHNLQVSTSDRLIANVNTAQVILTRDPAKWNLVIATFDAATGSLGLLVNTRGFTSTAGIGAVCGTTPPTFGSNTGLVTGATCNYRDWVTGNVDLRKSANAPLLAIILEYFETMYELALGV